MQMQMHEIIRVRVGATRESAHGWVLVGWPCLSGHPRLHSQTTCVESHTWPASSGKGFREGWKVSAFACTRCSSSSVHQQHSHLGILSAPLRPSHTPREIPMVLARLDERGRKLDVEGLLAHNRSVLDCLQNSSCIFLYCAPCFSLPLPGSRRFRHLTHRRRAAAHRRVELIVQ